MPLALPHASLGLAKFVLGPYLATQWSIELERAAGYTAVLLASIALCMVVSQIVSLRRRLDAQRLLFWGPLGMAASCALATVQPAALPPSLMMIAVALALWSPAAATGAAAASAGTAHGQAGSDLYVGRLLGHLLGVTAAGPLFELAPWLPRATAALVAPLAIPASRWLRDSLAAV